MKAKPSKGAKSSSKTSTSSDVKSPTKTSTDAYTSGNSTSTVTGGAGDGDTNVTIYPGAKGPPDKGKQTAKSASAKPASVRADEGTFPFHNDPSDGGADGSHDKSQDSLGGARAHFKDSGPKEQKSYYGGRRKTT